MPKLVDVRNEDLVSDRLFRKYLTNSHAAMYKQGDIVRIALPQKGAGQSAFRKGTGQSYSDETYVISDVLKTRPARYRLVSSFDSAPIEGSYYEPELFLVSQKSE